MAADASSRHLDGPGGLSVPVRLLGPHTGLPQRAYEDDAAYDLCAAEDVELGPLARAVVGTGIAIGLPPHMAALTLPRSGLAARHGITILNAPGLIDPGYRGEIAVILLNTDCHETFSVRVGERIAQLLFLPLTAVSMVASEGLDATQRGDQGFGSSGRAGPS